MLPFKQSNVPKKNEYRQILQHCESGMETNSGSVLVEPTACNISVEMNETQKLHNGFEKRNPILSRGPFVVRNECRRLCKN